MIKKWPEIIMYSRPLCGDCIRSKNFLENNQIPFQEINILEKASSIEEMKKINKGRESVPTIIINNNTVIIEPTDYDLMKAITKELDITETK